MEMTVTFGGGETKEISFVNGIVNEAMVDESSNAIVTDSDRTLVSANFESKDINLSGSEEFVVSYLYDPTLPFSFDLDESFDIDVEEE